MHTCPSGRYGAGLIGSKTKQDSCVECPLESINIESALTESAGCDQSCPGKYGSQAGASNIEAACKSCPGGHSNTSGITEALNRGVGKYSTSLGNQIESMCTLCAAGTYNSEPGADKLLAQNLSNRFLL